MMNLKVRWTARFLSPTTDNNFLANQSIIDCYIVIDSMSVLKSPSSRTRVYLYHTYWFDDNVSDGRTGITRQQPVPLFRRSE